MRRLEVFCWAFMFFWCVLALWPASFWYESGTVRVDDIYEGDRLKLYPTGHVVRNFLGSYSVIIRDSGTGEVVSDMSSTRFRYNTNSQRPDPVTIEWWAPGDKRAHNLPAGSYVMETCWTVHNAFYGIVLGKTTCTKSNVFRVIPRGEQ